MEPQAILQQQQQSLGIESAASCHIQATDHVASTDIEKQRKPQPQPPSWLMDSERREHSERSEQRCRFIPDIETHLHLNPRPREHANELRATTTTTNSKTDVCQLPLGSSRGANARPKAARGATKCRRQMTNGNDQSKQICCISAQPNSNILVAGSRAILHFWQHIEASVATRQIFGSASHFNDAFCRASDVEGASEVLPPQPPMMMTRAPGEHLRLVVAPCFCSRPQNCFRCCWCRRYLELELERSAGAEAVNPKWLEQNAKWTAQRNTLRHNNLLKSHKRPQHRVVSNSNTNISINRKRNKSRSATDDCYSSRRIVAPPADCERAADQHGDCYVDDDDGRSGSGDDNLMIDHASDERKPRLALAFDGQTLGKRNECGDERRAISLSRAPLRLALSANCTTGLRQVDWLQKLVLLALLLSIASYSPSVQFSHIGIRAAVAESSPHQSAKFQLWRQLLAPLIQTDGSQANGATNSAPALDRIAAKLSEWPQQRRAALFYLDLVARSRSSKTPSDLDWTSGNGAREAWCRRASLAELESMDEINASLGTQRGVNASSALSGEQLLAAWALEVSRVNELRAPIALLTRLRREPRFAGLAKLAVENANLISHLLAASSAPGKSAASDALSGISSERFYKFLLESKLRQIAQQHSLQSHNLQQQQQQQQQQSSSAAKLVHSMGLVFVRPRDKLHDIATSGARAAQTFQEPEFATLAVLDNDKISDTDELMQLQLQQSTDLTAARVVSADLLALDTASNDGAKLPDPNGYFGLNGGGLQPFYAKWLGDKQTIESLERKLAKLLDRRASGEQNSSLSAPVSLDLDDGRWFSPYLDCGRSNRWLLTYSIPFFASVDNGDTTSGGGGDGNNGADDNVAGVQFRGVSFVSLDLGRTKLIDQCADELGPAFLANTHQCARLAWSQCARLPHFQQVLSGAYICQCPAGGHSAAGERKANDERRERLTERLVSRAAANSSHALDQLVLDVDEQLTDRSYVLGQLSAQHYRSKSSLPVDHFAHSFGLGAQLESDANLEWFSGGSGQKIDDDDDDDSAADIGWPKQICRICRPIAAHRHSSAAHRKTNSSGSGGEISSHQRRMPPADDVLNGNTEQQYATLDDDSNCREFLPLGSQMNWVRPLVATIQSLCVLSTLILIGILLRIRKSRIILASGWLMLETILIGALFLYTSVIVRYFDSTSVTCLLEPWLRELGFSIFYGSILIKLYKILTEFQTRKAHRVLFRDKDQLVYLLAITLIVVGYMSAWTALMVDGFFFGRQVAAGGADSAHHAPAPSSSAQGHANTHTGGDEVATTGRELPLMEQATSYDQGFVSLAMDHLSELAPEQLRAFARQLNSFTHLFSGLVERHQHYERLTDSVSFSIRCRKLTWDYVTELSEMALLLFGINLVYKLRNASSESHKEKLVLSGAVFVELFVSALTYTARHLLWDQLTANQILLLYCARCQLTVSVTLGLVFGPKLYLIGKSKPTLFNWRGGRTVGGSTRHRCHISCELHDHHLDDAMKLHQAMLSNAALDIGSINLADMDPDEIQAELKRVYAQLEMLKTKAMRRDNPHISKRRGGRKTGHRKFSLQAFHAKHLAGHHAHAHNSNINSTASQHQQTAVVVESSQMNMHNKVTTNSAKLPVLVEQENNQCGADNECPRDARGTSGLMDTSNGMVEQQQQRESSGEKRSELLAAQSTILPADKDPQHHHNHNQQQQQQKLLQQNRQHRHRHHHHHHHHHHNHSSSSNHQQPHNNNSNNNQAARRSVVLADPTSTSSIGGVYQEEDTLILNDSQSSGNGSLHRQSSYVCSQSSIHPEDTSLS